MILALDLGTSCGYCLRDGDKILMSGTWDFSTNRYEGGGMRYLRFRKQLLDLIEVTPLDLIAYEEVRSHQSKNPKTGKMTMNVDAAHVYGGLMAELLAIADELDISTTAYPVGTIKKMATGKGRANKEMMLAAAQERWPELNIKTFDEADAAWIAECAWQEYRKAL